VNSATMTKGGLRTLAFALALGAALPARAEVLATFEGVREDRVGVRGFTMASDGEVKATALSFGYRSSGVSVTLSNAWILDANTREVAWEMRGARDEWKAKRLTEEAYSVRLPAGAYEVYYSTYPDVRERRRGEGDWFVHLFGHGTKGAIERMLDNEDLDEIEDAYRRLWFRLEGPGAPLDETAVRERQERVARDAIVALRRQGDHAYVQQGFAIDEPMRLRVYALGEAREDGEYDHAWIINADTRERVWRFTFRDSDHAGGTAKNRVVDSVFEAPAGRYVAFYATDGSHSFDRWNYAPPHDPAAWGITIRAADPATRAHARGFEYEDKGWKNAVVEIVEVGDGALVAKGFTLKKPMRLQVYTLGEGQGGRLYDYGWIVDARTRRRVWEMSYAETERGGGAEKNRLFDGTVELEKGDYVAYYATDDSHSYPEWNAAPPLDRRRWGITIAGGADFDARAVAPYDDAARRGDALASIVEVGDGAYLHREFALKKETTLLVYALGEGTGGRMYDYGWIEEVETGRVVWEMMYRKTSHAGGAEKNRMFSDTVTLAPGKYRLYYESDDSHSFDRWNATRPYDPHAWGIAVHTVAND